MLMRIVFASSLVVSTAACKSKAPAKATTPAAAPAMEQTESAPGGTPPAGGDAPDGTSTKGDPCDGGEVTPKQ